MAERIDHEGRATFVQTLPRKVAELRATLGTLVADPKSQRMRDELRRRLHALYTLTRSYNLPTLSDGLREGIAHLDAVRGATILTQRDLETLADLIATLPALAQRDLPDQPNLFARGARGPAGPSGAGTNATPGAPSGEASIRTTNPGVGGQTANVERETEGTAARGPLPSISSGEKRAPTLRGMPASRPPPPLSVGPEATREMLNARAAMAPPAPSLPGGMPSTTNVPLGVLVVGGVGVSHEIKRVMSPETEVTGVRALSEAITAARDTAPDVIVAETAAPADGLGLLAALRGDPLTDFLPVILLVPLGEKLDPAAARAQGATEVLPLPVEPERLREAIERAAGAVAQHSLPPPTFGDITLEDLTRTLQEEIRRGILGAAGPRQGGTKVSLGQGSEVLAATWEAIARVRDVVEKRTRGKVKFEMPAAPLGMGGAHVLSIGEDEEGAQDEAGGTDDPLPGRRALIVDDDPGVVWFFAGLLREAGMEISECTDGAAALSEARKVHPDVVISDILMPGIDGFALCRAIRRDVSLRHTPVILLSWKEDLLVRMRELGAQAQGFLRKESRGEAILARVRAVLRPRVRLLHRIEALTEGQELRGRVERVGVFTLLETAARKLVDATLAITDSFSVTEVEMRGGQLASIVRTAQDGSLARGEGALLQVLGASTARFTLRRANHAVRANVQGDIARLLAGGAALISALEESLSGAALLEVASIDLDGDGAISYSRSLPEAMRALVEQIVRGESPRNLILRDGVAPQELEPILVELARRGAIRSVRGTDGEDLVAPRYGGALGRDSLAPGERISLVPGSGKSPSIPPPLLTESERKSLGPGDPRSIREGVVAPVVIPRDSDVIKVWTPPTTIDEAAKPGFGIEPERDSLADAVLRELSEPPAPPTSDADDDEGPDLDMGGDDDADVSTPPTDLPLSDSLTELAATVTAKTPDVTEAKREEKSSESERATPEVTTASDEEKIELDARGLPRRRAATPETGVDKPKSPDAVARDATRSPAESSDGGVIVDEKEIGGRVERREAPKKPADEPRSGWLGLTLAVLGLGAASYFAVRYYLRATQPQPAVTAGESDAGAGSGEPTPVPPQETQGPREVAADSAAPMAVAAADAATSADASDDVASPTATTDAGSNPSANTASGPVDPIAWLDGGSLSSGRGLLVVDGVAPAGAEVRVNQQVMHTVPFALQLPPGMYTISFRTERTEVHRYEQIRAGQGVRVLFPRE